MTIDETLKQLLNEEFMKHADYNVNLKFIDVVRNMEHINGKKYQLFDYRKIENVLQTFDIYTFEYVDNHLGDIGGMDYGDLCVMNDTEGIPKVLCGWKDFKSVFDSHMDKTL